LPFLVYVFNFVMLAAILYVFYESDLKLHPASMN